MLMISPTQSNVQAALTAFLQNVLPGTAGGVPAVFVGSISGTTLTVAALPAKQPAGIQGTITAGSPLIGPGVAAGTQIVEQLTGATGGVGTYQITPSQTAAQPATMSTGVLVLAGQANRAPEPANPYFAILTPMRFVRIATNQDFSADCKAQGSLNAGVMTVSMVNAGMIEPGAVVYGGGVNPGTSVLRQLTGPTGGAGTYAITGTQSLSSRTLSTGQVGLVQEARCEVQIDFHAPDTQAGDFAQIVSTALRDPYGTAFFAALSPPLNGVSPMHADDPRQVPFINDQNQYEWRWSVDAALQVNQTILVPSEFADSVTVEIEDVNAVYPP